MNRLILAINAFWTTLKGENISPEAVAEPTSEPLPEPDVDTSAEQNEFDSGAVYTLVLLQREGRLIDFLQEAIEGYSDDQIGAATRRIHQDCKKIFDENFQVTPIVSEPEGAPITIDGAYDPSSIKLTGKVADSPPYKGILRHKGWKISKPRFPARTGKVNPGIIQSAEVEIL